MKKDNKEIEQYRVTSGVLGSTHQAGNNGCFIIPTRLRKLTVVVSDGLGWDHVSVSTKGGTPSWEEMSLVKNLFFSDEETVVQFHPKKTKYINIHPNCLHLWRKQDTEYELPPKEMV